MADSSSVKTPILGASMATEQQMRDFVRRTNPHAPDYAQLYVDMGRKYGVRGDLAFAQAILETNYWRFGGSVRQEQNNFAGLGATSPTQGGAAFATPAKGIEAQMQHLFGYATKAVLPADALVVDPRFALLESSGLRGIAPCWEDLNGKWAVPGANYGQNIVSLWQNILSLPITPNQWKQDALEWLATRRLIDSPHDPDAGVTWAELGVVMRRLYNEVRGTD